MHILLVDDDSLIREIMPVVLRKALNEVSVRTESDLAGAFEYVHGGGKPDVAVLDLGLPGCTGLDALTRFREKFPDIPVLVLSGTDDGDSIRAAFRAGAVGYVPKTAARDTLVGAVRVVAEGGTYIPMGAMETVDSLPFAPAGGLARAPGEALKLTELQTAVLRLVLQGHTDPYIAETLNIAEASVEQHVRAVCEALGVRTRSEALIAAVRRGIRFD